jgi:hypothetical protein
MVYSTRASCRVCEHRPSIGGFPGTSVDASGDVGCNNWRAVHLRRVYKRRENVLDLFLISVQGFPSSEGNDPLSIYTRFIRLAANPAPNPLSMLTTVTPAAQEFNMPSRAASP